jgi:hypothetical protein
MQIPDRRHRRLLRPRPEWPRSRRAAEQRDEIAPSDVIKYLLQDCQLVSNNCPINVYGQAWTLMMTMRYARCAGDCRRICTRQRCANKYPTLAGAEIPTQHIFGVFNGRDAGPG